MGMPCILRFGMGWEIRWDEKMEGKGGRRAGRILWFGYTAVIVMCVERERGEGREGERMGGERG